MRVTRRKVLALTASAAVVGLTKASAADLTTDKIPTRIPLQEFVKDAALMDAFRRGVRAMKARPPSDPLSWFFQAAMHGVTLELIQIQAQKDPNIINVDQKKWWNQCPHFGQASANFLPWHRAYTHYFERILRAHAQEPRFALPYWDYSDKNYRLFPEEWGRANLKTPLDGDDSNPLYHSERNLFFTAWDHWSGEDGPYSEFSELAVDWLQARDAPVFFGSKDDIADERQGLAGNVADEDAYTRGRLESFPHDPIHRLVGGVVVMPPQPDPMHPGTPIQGESGAGGMATPPTAGFDPIFCVHHSNIDRLWAEWSCMDGKEWGRFPPQSWFDDTPWNFFDVAVEDNGLKAVAVDPKPRKYYFDYRALGISFKSEDLSKTPMKLPDPIPTQPPPAAAVLVGSLVAPTLVTTFMPERVAIARAETTLITPLKVLGTDKSEFRTFMRISGVKLTSIQTTGFEVYLTDNAAEKLTRSHLGFVGTIALFRHDMPTNAAMAAMRHESSDVFDVTGALKNASQVDPSKLHIVIKPFSLANVKMSNTQLIETGSLTFDGVEFFTR